MAYVAMGGTHVTQGVAGATFVEGIAVTISASGLHDDLPTVLPATAGARNVFVVMAAPDMFPRPTPARMFQRNQIVTRDSYADLPLSVSGLDPQNSVEFLIDSGQRGPFYLIGPSMLRQPVIASGWAVQLHKGGAYTLTESCFTDSASIRNIGATIRVGTGGKFEYSTTAAEIVGYVREFRDGRLTIVLDQRSA